MTNALVDRLRARVRLLRRPAGPLPRLSRRGQAFDVLLVVLLLSIVAIFDFEPSDRPYPTGLLPWPQPEPPLPPLPPGLPLPSERPPSSGSEDWIGEVLLMLLATVPLVFRRRYPLAILWIVVGAAPLMANYQNLLRLSFYACVIAAYSAAVYSPYRVPALASLPLAALSYSRLHESEWPAIPDSAVPFLILIPVAVTAHGLRRWKGQADARRARLSTLEREQADALHRAVEHERARIARELHDVVTHNVSVMVIQAGAARKVMADAPDQAREALLAVEAGGRAAMTELRHVMGLLAMDTDGHEQADLADLTPQPGLDQLDALVARVRDTGVSVTLTVAGQPRPVPSGVELAVYRVVQEALTNTVKHAAGATATVAIEYGADDLQVEVTDTGGTPGESAATGTGSGLIGLRSRLALYGGTLRAGPRTTGGYRVNALIPLEAS